MRVTKFMNHFKDTGTQIVNKGIATDKITAYAAPYVLR